MTEAGDVTYERLNRSANAVARAILSRLGDGQHVVALLFEQGLPSITATLGALKAGKVYAPLDPRAPQTMLSALMKELQPDLVLAGGGHLGTAEDVASAGIALLDIAEVDPVGWTRILQLVARQIPTPTSITRLAPLAGQRESSIRTGTFSTM